MNITISQTHWVLTGRRGAAKRRKVDPAPTYVRIFSHHILIALRSAITPRDGLMIATSNAAPETENDHIASLDIDLERTVVVRPFASKKRRANQNGRIAVVTLVSNADFPQSKNAYPLTAFGSDARSNSTVSDMSIMTRRA